MSADAELDDVQAVRTLLGREPQAGFRVVVRDAAGSPVVIRNRPLLDDGTPMPTRFRALHDHGTGTRRDRFFHVPQGLHLTKQRHAGCGNLR